MTDRIENRSIPIPTYNALFLTRVFAKHFVANLTSEELIRLFECRSSSSMRQQQSSNTTSDPEKLPILPQVEDEDRPKIEQLLDALLSLLINLNAK